MSNREPRHDNQVIDRQAIANAFRDILLRHHPPQAAATSSSEVQPEGGVREDGNDAEATDRDRLVPLRLLAASDDRRSLTSAKENAETRVDATVHPHVNFVNLSPVPTDSRQSLSPTEKPAHGSPNGKSAVSEVLPTISIGVPPRALERDPQVRKSSEEERARRSQCARSAKDVALCAIAALFILGVIISSIVVSLKLGGEPRQDEVPDVAHVTLTINKCITVIGYELGNNSREAPGGPVVVFERVPFAVPPRRWQLSEAIDNERACTRLLHETTWRDTPPPCLHYDAASDTYVGADDCLYAMVHTPKIALSGDTRMRPVVLALQSQSYCRPQRPDVAASARLVQQLDAVLVSVPTRTALGGYMTWDASQFAFERATAQEGEEDLFGGPLRSNVALSDAIAALRFVRAHAASFGGSADDVLLAASGAAASDLLVLLSTRLRRPANANWDAAQFYKALWLAAPPMHFARRADANNNAAKRTAIVLQRSACGSHAADRIGCLRNLTYAQLANLTRQLMRHEPELFSALRCDEPSGLPRASSQLNVATTLPYAADADWFSAAPFETWLSGGAAINLSARTMDAKHSRLVSTSESSSGANGSESESDTAVYTTNWLAPHDGVPFSTKVPILLTTSFANFSSGDQSVSQVALQSYLRNMVAAFCAQAGRNLDSTLRIPSENLVESVTSFSLLQATVTRVCPLAVFADLALINRPSADSHCEPTLDDYVNDVGGVRSGHPPFNLLLFDLADGQESEWSLVFSDDANFSQARRASASMLKRVLRDSLYYDPFRVRLTVNAALPGVRSLANSSSSFYCLSRSAESSVDALANDATWRVARTCYALYLLAAELFSASSDVHSDVLYFLSQFSQPS